MSRKKPKVVKTITDKAGYSADILLDQNDLDFHAEIKGMQFRSRLASEVEAWIWTQLEALNELVWIPVIYVKCLRPNGRDTFALAISVGVEYARFLIARTADERVLSLDWQHADLKNEAKLSYAHHRWSVPKEAAGQLPLRKESWEHLEAWLPYDDKVWRGLEALKDTIVGVRQKLADIVSTDEGIKFLTTAGALPQLMSGNEEERG